MKEKDVICINDVDYEGQLTNGNVYRVLKVDTATLKPMYAFTGDDGNRAGAYTYRFKEVMGNNYLIY